LIGQTLSHYKILSKIGEGGMGVVYEALDTRLGRHVAIKVLPPRMAESKDRRRRFEREAKAIAALRHPNVVTIHSVEEADGHHFLTMELIDGRPLSEMIPTDGLPLPNFFEIAIQIAEALGTAHVAGITHRDLKPANVMVEPDGRVKVLDFGLARLLEPDAAEMEDAPTAVKEGSDTEEGMVLGTVPYLSPEQAEGKPVDPRSDIFSLGIMLYEMATGERPFQGDTALSLLSSILKDTPPTVTDVRRHLPRQLARIVEHCLAKDPRRRFQSALDVANQLEMLRTEVTTGSGRERIVAPRRMNSMKRIALPAAAVVLAVIAFTLGPGLFDRSGTTESMAETPSLAIFAFENLKAPDDPERIGQILQELLITDLSGLDAVNVYSGQRLRDLQKQVDASGERGNEAYGEIARRAGANTMLTGTLSQLGAKWILTCQVSDVAQGTIVQSNRIDGTDIYGMVDRLSLEIQEEYRLAGGSGVSAKIPVREKTSGSLEAYRHYLTGVDHLNALAYVDAIEEFEKAIDIDPAFGKAYYKLAIAKWWQSSVGGAEIESIRIFLENELYASEKERRMAETMDELMRREFVQALPLAEALTRDYPDEKEAWYALGEAQYHYPGQSRRFESLASFEKAMALDPDFQLPWGHVRSVMLRRGDEEGLRDKIEELLAGNPGNPFWHRERARTTVRVGTAEDTRRAVEEALRFNTKPADRRELYKNVAVSADDMGYEGEAIVYFRKALEADRDHLDETIVQDLARLLRKDARYDEAEQVLDTYLSGQEFEQAREGMRVWILNDQHEFSRCLRIATTMARKYPDNILWLFTWAEQAIDAGDDAALADMLAETESRGLSPASRRRVYEQVGRCWRWVGHWNEAKKYCEKAVAIGGNEADAGLLSELAEVEILRGRVREAGRLLRRALEISPHLAGAIESMVDVHLVSGELDTALVYARRYADEVRSYRGERPLAEVHLARGELDRTERFLNGMSPRVAGNLRYDSMIGLGFWLATIEPDRAQAFIREALEMEIAGRNPFAQEISGVLKILEGDCAAAGQMFEKAVAIDDRLPGGWRGLAVVSLLEGRNDDAERYLEEWGNRERPAGAYHRLRAHVLVAGNRHEEARAEAERAVAIDSTRVSCEVLAWVLISGNLDLDAGLAMAERAAALPYTPRWEISHRFDDWISAEHSLGLGYLAKGDPGKAVAYLEKVAAKYPERESVRRDLARAREIASKSP
jgi:tetratricopeptide (TPR) repeat protein